MHRYHHILYFDAAGFSPGFMLNHPALKGTASKNRCQASALHKSEIRYL